MGRDCLRSGGLPPSRAPGHVAASGCYVLAPCCAPRCWPLAVGCSMFAAGCSLLAVCCSLLAAGCCWAAQLPLAWPSDPLQSQDVQVRSQKTNRKCVASTFYNEYISCKLCTPYITHVQESDKLCTNNTHLNILCFNYI